MGWFTGNRRRALGITLLIAAPVACGLLLGASAVRPQSAKDMLHFVPLFPGARNTQYATLEEPSWGIWNGETDQVVYRVDDQPRAVFDFYSDTLEHAGWDILGRGRQRYEFSRADRLVSGISFKRDAPWINIEQRELRRRTSITIYRLENNGDEFTEVPVEFTPAAYYFWRL